jgi:hypothetical protein
MARARRDGGCGLESLMEPAKTGLRTLTRRILHATERTAILPRFK